MVLKPSLVDLAPSVAGLEVLGLRLFEVDCCCSSSKFSATFGLCFFCRTKAARSPLDTEQKDTA